MSNIGKKIFNRHHLTTILLLIFTVVSCKSPFQSSLIPKQASALLGKGKNPVNPGELPPIDGLPPSQPTFAPGEPVPQDPPATLPAPSPIASGQSCLNKNASMLTKLGFNDPMIDCQWHLMHRGQSIPKTLPSGSVNYPIIGTSGADINAYSAYEQGHSGRDVNILITDNSFDKNHPDMAANYNKTLSVGCGDKFGVDPEPGADSDNHGIMVSGLAGAVGKNGIGVSGVAYNAKVSGSNLSVCDSYDSSFNAPSGVHIWNGSWGVTTPGAKPVTMQTVTLQVEQGVKRGITYFLASGNERRKYGDHQIDDVYVSPFIIYVAALQNNGSHTVYSSPGAAIFVSSFGGTDKAYLNSQQQMIYDDPGTITIDRNSKYVTIMNGTSAASPIAAGAGAVIKSANPNINPIDLMYILARTSTFIPQTRETTKYIDHDLSALNKKYINWTRNSKNYYHSFDHGFGKINLGEAVKMAKAYTKNLPIPKRLSTTLGTNIPTSSSDIVSIAPKSCATKKLFIDSDFQVFNAELTFDLSIKGANNLGSLVIYYTLPSKVKAQFKRYNGSSLTGTGLAHTQKWYGYAGFGENAKGEWEVEICQTGSTGTVEWKEFKLDIYGFSDMSSIAGR